MILGPPHQEIALTGGSSQGFEITALCLGWSEVTFIAEGEPLAKLSANGVVITLVAMLLKLAESPLKSRTGGLASWQTQRVTELLPSRSKITD
ncbi:MAG: hypothetical protein HC921_20435 [Synechococcaceae cyanobacterium SM2_3_1]|nr:hypothetical protein [Synechococcaceae cyanobacterium SM2_3_1]